MKKQKENFKKIKMLLLLSTILIAGVSIAIFSCSNSSMANQQTEEPKYLLTIPPCFAGDSKSVNTSIQTRADSSTDEAINVFFGLIRSYLVHIEGAVEASNSIIDAIEKAKNNNNLGAGDSWTGSVDASTAVSSAWIKIEVGSSDSAFDFSHDGAVNSYRNRVTIKTSESGNNLFEMAYTKMSDTRFVGEFIYDYKAILGLTDPITDQPKNVYFKFDSEDSNGDNSVLAKAYWQDNSADTTGFPIRVIVNMVANGDNFAIDGCSYHDHVGDAPLFTKDTSNDGVASDNYRKRIYYFYGSANRTKDKGELNVALPTDYLTQTGRSDIFASDFTNALNFSVGAIVKRAISYYICRSTDSDMETFRILMHGMNSSFSDLLGSVVTANSSNYTIINNIITDPQIWSNLSDDIKLWWSIKNPVYFDTNGYAGHIASPPSDGTSDYILGQSLEAHIAGTNLIIAPNKLYKVDETIIVFPW